MRHRKAGRNLGRTTAHRESMIRNMVTSVIQHERIVTTTPKAKEARRYVDKMITLAKRGDVHARRQALGFIRDKDAVGKLFSTLREEYMNRNGGYTRIIQTGNRIGDAAPMAILELVNYQEGKVENKAS